MLLMCHHIGFSGNYRQTDSASFPTGRVGAHLNILFLKRVNELEAVVYVYVQQETEAKGVKAKPERHMRILKIK